MKIKLAIIILGLILPAFYQYHRRNPQLDYLHSLPEGSLTFHPQSLSKLQSNLAINNPKNLQFTFQGHPIFRKNTNFFTLLRSKAEVEAHGDSFYNIVDIPEQVCIHQIITELERVQNQVKIKGFFEDCEDSGYTSTLKTHEKKIVLGVEINSRQFNRIKVSFDHENDRNYYGLGEQFSHLSLGVNRPYSMLVREKGVGRTQQPETSYLNFMYGVGGNYYGSYNPAPIWMSSQKIGYVLDSYAYAAWINNQILVWDRNISIHILVGNSFKEVIGGIAEINGYTDPVPDWVNEGAILGLQGNTSNVLKKYYEVRKAGAIVSGVWIQDWVNKRQSLGNSRLWWNWELDTKHYEGWDSMRETFSKDNVELLIYMNPMFVNISSKKTYTKNYYEEGIKNDHFVKLKNGQIFETSAFSDYRAAMMNFDKSNSTQFYQDVMKLALSTTGAAGMMVDFSQAYPIQNTGVSIEEAMKNHNEYPLKYHSKVRELFNSLPNSERIYSFARAGYLKAPKYIHSLWAGDQAMNFKKNTGLPSCLTAILSSGLIGYSNTHCDIGGYTFFTIFSQPVSSRTYILLERWLQLAAFSPVFRSHEGIAPEKTLQVYSDQRAISDFAFYSNIFSVLKNYRKKQAVLSKKQKIPLIRPLFMECQNSRTLNIDDQYFLGNDILVNPLLSPKSERSFYLPEGDWVNIWNKQQIKGSGCIMEWNSFFPPIFIKGTSEFKLQILQGIERVLNHFNRLNQAHGYNHSTDI